LEKQVIFILSEFFYPISSIGAIRMTKIAKFLALNDDFSVNVLCRTSDGFTIDSFFADDIKNINNIYRVEGFKLLTKLRLLNLKKQEKISSFTVGNDKSLLKNLKSEFIKLLNITINTIDAYLYKKRAVKILSSKKIDILISTFNPKASTLIAKEMKIRNPKLFWIADFRDPVVRDYPSRILKKIDENFVAKHCKEANVITAVSAGFLKKLFISHPKMVVISNGYDNDDIANINYNERKEFTLSYLGRLYPLRSDLSPLFLAISELIAERKIEEKNIKIVYAGPSLLEFNKQINNFNLKNIVEEFNYLPRSESLKKQLESNLLVLASWNNIGSEGIVTGKLLEYMMIKRPIVALVKGDLQNSKVKEIMGKGNLGICYEEVSKEIDILKLKDFIQHQYEVFVNKGEINFNPNVSYLDDYNYKTITSQFVSLFPQKIE
jgi:hypothetical protein